MMKNSADVMFSIKKETEKYGLQLGARPENFEQMSTNNNEWYLSAGNFAIVVTYEDFCFWFRVDDPSQSVWKELKNLKFHKDEEENFAWRYFFHDSKLAAYSENNHQKFVDEGIKGLLEMRDILGNRP